MSARDSGSDEARKAKPEQSEVAAEVATAVATFGAFVRKPANAPRGC